MVTPGGPGLEDRLRRELAARASDIAVTPDPQERAYAGIASARRRRRTAVGGAVAAAVLAAVAVVVAPRGSDAPAPPPVPSVALGGAATGDVTTWPARGSLAGDTAFLDAVARRLEGVGRVVRRIVYAGDVGGSRIVLAVVGPEGSDQSLGEYALDLTGPRGAKGWALVPGAETLVDTGTSALAWAAPPRGATTSWVVLAPSSVATIQTSPMPSYDDTGAPQRSWSNVSLNNGVAAGELPAAEAVGVRVRVWGEPDIYRNPEYDGPLTGASFDPGSRPGDEVLADYSPDEPLTDRDVSNLSADIGRQHGVRADRVEIVTQWVGRVGRYLWAIVAVMRLPDGSTFQSVRVREERPDGSGGQFDVIAGRPVPRRGAESHPAVWLDWGGHRGAEERVFVVAPGARTARLLGGDAGRQPREQIAAVNLRNGTGSLVLRQQPDGWRPVEWALETTTRTGATTAWPVQGRHDEDPLDLFADR